MTDKNNKTAFDYFVSFITVNVHVNEYMGPWEFHVS